MIRIEISGTESLERVNKVLAGVPGGAARAITSASRRAADQAKTKAGTFAAQEYTISKGTFMAETRMKLAVSEGFTLTFSGSVLPLKRFRTRQTASGALTSVKRGSSARLAHVFTGPGGHFFERSGKERLPIEKKFGPSTGQMMQNDKIVDQMEQTISETFEKRIEVELNRVLAGL